jgi:hypothetical protein
VVVVFVEEEGRNLFQDLKLWEEDQEGGGRREEGRRVVSVFESKTESGEPTCFLATGT